MVLGVTEPSGLVSRRHPPLGSGSGSNPPTENREGNWGILEVPGWLVMAGLREQGDLAWRVSVLQAPQVPFQVRMAFPGDEVTMSLSWCKQQVCGPATGEET